MFDIRELTGKIGEAYSKKTTEAVEDFRKKENEILGNEPRRKVVPRKFSGTVCASDSGTVEFGLSGGSLLVMKGIGVVFSYKDGKLNSNVYFPSKAGARESHIILGSDEAESYAVREIRRLMLEWSLIMEMIGKRKCDIALVDGSLVPLPSARPSKSSPYHQEYAELEDLISKTRNLAKEKGILIVGVIKDSRSKRIANIIGRDISDVLIFDKALGTGEATAPLEYSEERKDVLFSYVKLSKSEMPMRVEWFADEKDPLEDIFALCTISGYRYPPALAEADLRAMLRKTECEIIEKEISSRFPGLVKRRDRRPFRK